MCKGCRESGEIYVRVGVVELGERFVIGDAADSPEAIKSGIPVFALLDFEYITSIGSNGEVWR